MHTVKFKNSLAIHDFIYSTLIKKLVLKIKEIENFESLKLNPELTRYILSCIYKEVILIGKSWSKKVDIKEILIHILKTAFNLNTDEVDQLIAQIDFILDNSLVKKKSNFKICSICKFAKSIFPIDSIRNFTNTIKTNWNNPQYYIHLIKSGIINFIENSIENVIPVPQIQNYNNLSQIITFDLLIKLGVKYKIVVIIIMFL